MSGILNLRGALRRPTRREGIALALLVLFVAVVEPFEPYIFLQRPVTAALNAKAYDGDAALIAIDAKTESELPNKVWSKSDLADLLIEVRTLSPRQVIIAQQYFDEGNQAGSEKLASALASLPQKPVWQIDLAPEDVREMSRDSPATLGGTPAGSSHWVEPAIADLVEPAAAVFRSAPLGAPTQTPFGYQTGQGFVPSMAKVLAGEIELPRTNEFEIDASYDPRTIPRLSAIDVLSGQISPSEIQNKQIVIGFSDGLGRDTLFTPLDPYAPRAALSIVAAQTLIDGPPVNIGWLPAFLVAIAASILWITIRRPWGRWIAVAALFAIFLSPLVLERYLIFQATSNGLTLIALLGIGKFWQRGRAAIQVYRNAAETKSQFLAQASHDLRQPIHAIGLLADRLSQTDLSVDQKEIVSKISWSVDNARRMFRALLDIAAIESGTLQKEVGSVSINELLAEVDSQNALAAEQANLDLRLVPSDLVIKTDRALLGTMLQNLVSNAIRYSPGGRIVVGCRRKGQSLSFVVADNGRGISPDELENVQKEFYRSSGKSNLSTVNKGLGLAIVNRLAEVLDLRFELQSKLGEGTTASIHGLEVIRTEINSVSAATDKRLPLSGLQVVIADDDQETLDSTGELLRKWGCEVSAFTEFPDKAPACDIILSDFDFGFGGTLADHSDLLAGLEAQGTKLIIISGHHPDQIRDLLPAHTGLILTKPLRAAQLRSALMSLRSS